MDYTLLSPVKIVAPKSGSFQAAVEANRDDIYSINENGLEIKKTIRTFYKSVPDGQFKAHIPVIGPVTSEVAETYLKFQSIIAHCNISAEGINNQLRDFLLGITELKYTKEDLLTKDFMALRGIFSEFLHGYTAIKREINFNTKELRSGLTGLMHQFITDRNIYTHGILRIQRPEDLFVIDYIENKKRKLRCEVTIDTLESFLIIAELIRTLLNQVGTFYRNSKK